MMILTGFAGQISLGHAAFLAIGAYHTAILGGDFGAPFWLVIPVAGVFAALVGLAIGPFALRFEGLYLAIVTLALVLVVEHVLRNGAQTRLRKGLPLGPDARLVLVGPPGLGSFREDARSSGRSRSTLRASCTCCSSRWPRARSTIGKNLRAATPGAR